MKVNMYSVIDLEGNIIRQMYIADTLDNRCKSSKGARLWTPCYMCMGCVTKIYEEDGYSVEKVEIIEHKWE